MNNKLTALYLLSQDVRITPPDQRLLTIMLGETLRLGRRDVTIPMDVMVDAIATIDPATSNRPVASQGEDDEHVVLSAMERLSGQRVTITSVDETKLKSCTPLDGFMHLEDDDTVQVTVNRLFQEVLEEIARTRGIRPF